MQSDSRQRVHYVLHIILVHAQQKEHRPAQQDKAEHNLEILVAVQRVDNMA